MHKSRRKGREQALRALYEMEVGKLRVDQAVRNMRDNADIDEDLLEFAELLVRGVHERYSFLDDKISSRVAQYDLDRVAVVDRNLLRIAAYELYFLDDIPPKVSINEAIELAKKYSTAESGRFVNGVLANMLTDSPKARWKPARPAEDLEEEMPPTEPAPEEETLSPDDPEAKELARIGLWKIRSDGAET